MRAALYARVSIVDRGQDPEVQLGDLREYAARRGFEVVAEFVDFASGARNGRPEYQRMLDAARKWSGGTIVSRAPCRSWSMPSRSSGRLA